MITYSFHYSANNSVSTSSTYRISALAQQSYLVLEDVVASLAHRRFLSELCGSPLDVRRAARAETPPRGLRRWLGSRRARRS